MARASCPGRPREPLYASCSGRTFAYLEPQARKGERRPSMFIATRFVWAPCCRRPVTYYEVPAEYHAPNYRYTIVNNRAVLVEPHSRRIVEIID